MPIERVVWPRVGLFYAIAFGFACVLGGILYLAGANMSAGPPPLVFQLGIAFIYMPAPLIAGLVVEHMARRPALIRRTWRDLRTGWARVLGISVLSAAGVCLTDLGLVAAPAGHVGAASASLVAAVVWAWTAKHLPAWTD